MRLLLASAFLLTACGGGPTVLTGLPWLVASEQVEGEVAVVAVLDFECEHSRDQFAVLASLADEPGLRITRRYFPREHSSMPAARAALCSREQGRETVFGPALFQARHAKGRALSASDVLELAEETDMEPRAFRQCVETELSTTLVQREVGELERVGVDALPTLFVGRERHDGFLSAEGLRASAERERARFAH